MIVFTNNIYTERQTAISILCQLSKDNPQMSEASTNELTDPDASQKPSPPGLIDVIEMDSGLPAKHYDQPLHHISISSDQQQ